MTELRGDLKLELTESMIAGDEVAAEKLAKIAIGEGVDPLELIQTVIVPTLTEIGRHFQEFEIFLPELMMAGAAAEKISQQAEKAALAGGGATTQIGTVVIGQAEDDMHDIGRNIVCTMLTAHGFQVVDLGRDVPATAFLEAAKKDQADIIAISALMTTTLPAQRRTLNLFKETGERENYKMIVGGGACSSVWADEIGSDGYSRDAAGAVDLCKNLVEHQ